MSLSPQSKTNLTRVPGDGERAQDEAGASDIDLVADEDVDDLHERGLDGLRVLEIGDGMEARFGRVRTPRTIR
jgi:hypothetical protein